jgi:methionyl-tRNA synthetase
MARAPFYVTTPIYYVNDRPHIGTAYTTIVADALARYARLRGRPTRFLTGLDEHGQKIERRAKERGITPAEYVNGMEGPFKDAWRLLGCSYDDFIRTTEPRHEARVQELWRRCEKNGDIYLGAYEGWYCVADEAFYTEKELVDGKSPTGRPVERVKEPSYFFRLSKYTQPLLDFYARHPDFVRPEGRYNEVKRFVEQGLQDLSISRTTFTWGIPVPNDPAHVMYVWFDALANYVSALGAPADAETDLFRTFWGTSASDPQAPAADVVHLVGKDILRFHAVYWPAFLLSAGLPPPRQVFAHGWLTVDGEKMSKSAGNFIPPEPIAEALGPDVLRYYLLREIALGQDGDFSHKNLFARYHGDLGNGLGNLLSRILPFLVKQFDGKIPPKGTHDPKDALLLALARTCAKSAAEHFEAIAPQRALEVTWELVVATNKYVDEQAPWALAKKGDVGRLGEVLRVIAAVLDTVSRLLWPVLPQKCDALRAQLGLAALAPSPGEDLWPPLPDSERTWPELEGTTVAPGSPLFPRFEAKEEAAILARLVPPPRPTASAAASAPVTSGAPSSEPAITGAPPISIDDFAKVRLVLGLVLAAERVPKSDKLLKLSVDVGEGTPRQILAGIGKTYAPEALVGKRIVVVANLSPRKMMGLESHGMVLAASDADGLSVLTVDGARAPGSVIR